MTLLPEMPSRQKGRQKNTLASLFLLFPNLTPGTVILPNHEPVNSRSLDMELPGVSRARNGRGIDLKKKTGEILTNP